MSGLRHLPIIAGPTSQRSPFTFSAATRVGFSDTDAQGIVYYGRYAPYFDIARVEYWRNLGLAAHDDPDRGEFVMRAFNIEYHAPAMFDDLLVTPRALAVVAGAGHLSFSDACQLVPSYAECSDPEYLPVADVQRISVEVAIPFLDAARGVHGAAEALPPDEQALTWTSVD